MSTLSAFLHWYVGQCRGSARGSFRIRLVALLAVIALVITLLHDPERRHFQHHVLTNPFFVPSVLLMSVWLLLGKYVQYRLAATDHACHTGALLRLPREYKQLFGADRLYCLYFILLFATVAFWVALIVTV